ncbi:hypothetical protein [Micromonospora sp. CPCC 205556]|uniref:hypothetical protein n=1 Tax=Micromonospora sp. CPCC 205556 TaxID=3122398 RepID=UPI002FEF884B
MCLAEASSADTDRLNPLVNRPAARCSPVDPVSWRALAVVYDTVGRLDAANTLLAAVDHGCNVLTGLPGLYAGLAGGQISPSDLRCCLPLTAPRSHW